MKYVYKVVNTTRDGLYRSVYARYLDERLNTFYAMNTRSYGKDGSPVWCCNTYEDALLEKDNQVVDEGELAILKCRAKVYPKKYGFITGSIIIKHTMSEWVSIINRELHDEFYSYLVGTFLSSVNSGTIFCTWVEPYKVCTYMDH